MSKIKTEKSVAKFNEGRDDEWEIVENYHEMTSRHYVEGELINQPVEKPCKHATCIVEEKNWQREFEGKKHKHNWVKWIIPRVVRKRAEDPYYVTTICLDCILEKTTEQYG